MNESTTVQVLLWAVLPYVTIAVFVVGMIWRYRYDKFGWTTRSSQLYERTLIRVASPLFHIGILAVVAGQIIAGVCTLTGIVLLIYRRRTVGPVFSATTGNDKFMYVFLAAAICLGLITTFYGSGIFGPAYNYRDTVAVWFRSIFFLNPQIHDMAIAPPSYQVHAIAGMLLFIIWPFTRLVHAFSAPIGYVFRPYVVYRDRGTHDPGSRPDRRGWEKIGQ
jgi:nitrate reductase gamma subunit